MPVFDNLNCEFEQGSFTLLVGETGVGKTTLLRLLKPEIAPEGARAGAISLFGKDISTLSHEESGAWVGYVFQSPETQIVCDSVWHELAFGLENMGVEQNVMRRRIAEVAQFFGIERWMARDTSSLSGGQKQMLNLASIMVMQPKLLLLDEPTAQLDSVVEKNFLHALFRVNRELGVSVIVATHSPEVMADYATQCFVLEKNSIKNCDISSPLESPSNYKSSVASSAAFACASTQTTLALSGHDLWFRYQKDDPYVLQGADIEIKKGEVHAIVGGNGSGKTTLLRLMAQALKPEHGLCKNMYFGNQALLPQDPKALFVCDTVKEELLEWRKRCGYTEADVDKILMRFGLDRQAQLHPFDTSGGQQQKIALAKVLLTKPELLFLDEPTKGLDRGFRIEMIDIFGALKREGKTLVLVTHDLSFAEAVADKVSMLFNGEIVCTDETAAFFKNNIFYRPDCKLMPYEQVKNGHDE